MTAVHRRVLGLVLAAIVGLVPLVPAEHVHEVEEHGHLELVVHRHVGNHSLFPATAHHDDHRLVLDHPDAPINTRDQDYIVPGVRHLLATADSVPLAFLEPIPVKWVAFTGFVERLSHAPPTGPTPQRGPPFTPAS